MKNNMLIIHILLATTYPLYTSITTCHSTGLNSISTKTDLSS